VKLGCRPKNNRFYAALTRRLEWMFFDDVAEEADGNETIVLTTPIDDTNDVRLVSKPWFE